MKKLKYLFLFIILHLLTGFGMIQAESTELNFKPLEYKVKAKFIYNFVKFVKWPDEKDYKALKVCILGKDPFGHDLQILKDKKVRNMPFILNYCEKIDDIMDCNILFISISEQKNLAEILSHCSHHPILTIGDYSEFTHHGGIINLIKADDNIRFEINIDAAKQSGLNISSQLLKLARIVNP